MDQTAFPPIRSIATITTTSAAAQRLPRPRPCRQARFDRDDIGRHLFHVENLRMSENKRYYYLGDHADIF